MCKINYWQIQSFTASRQLRNFVTRRNWTYQWCLPAAGMFSSNKMGFIICIKVKCMEHNLRKCMSIFSFLGALVFKLPKIPIISALFTRLNPNSDLHFFLIIIIYKYILNSNTFLLPSFINLILSNFGEIFFSRVKV